MAHVKAAANRAHQGVNIRGKRPGVKIYAGQKVKPGMIIVRQRGTKIHPGVGTKLGRDFTIYAVKEGIVKFRRLTGKKRNQKAVDVV